jgi:hypothetical protein
MTVEDDGLENCALLRLRVTAEADAGSLSRVLGYFQNINVIPRRILAEFATTGAMHVEVDISGLSEARLSLIAAKISQSVSVLNAYWHRV